MVNKRKITFVFFKDFRVHHRNLRGKFESCRGYLAARVVPEARENVRKAGMRIRDFT